MRITNIHEHWGSTVEFDNPLDFFKVEKNTWRDLIYKRKLLIFKRMKITDIEYCKFSTYFGMPWTSEEYKYSHEQAIVIRDDDDKLYSLTKFSSKSVSNNINRTIGVKEMNWHADIPNRSFRPFPFRSLWMGQNPRTEESGKTQWLNLEDGIEYLSPELKKLMSRITVRQQSWYDGGGDYQMHDFIKVHPVTGKKSLRLNFYVGSPNVRSDHAWIKNVYIDNVQQPDQSLIQEYIDELLKFPELFYRHTWDEKDIAIYDNYSFVHGRTALKLQTDTDEPLERILYRINIDHMDNATWSNRVLS